MNKSTQRLTFVDYLRGAAAMSVAWFHISRGGPDGILKTSGDYGYLGVEVFFVISGFIIPWSILHADNLSATWYGKFLAKRAVRIELPYLASIVMILLVQVVSEQFPAYGGAPLNVTPQLIIFHIVYLVPFVGMEWIQTVYWTLAYEFVFYLFVGAAFTTVINGNKRWPLYGLFLILGACVVTKVITIHFLLFCMGIMTFRARSGRTTIAESVSAIVLLAILMGVAGGWLEACVGVGTAVLLIWASNFALPGRLGGLVQWFGAISFSLYLVHVPVSVRVLNLGRRFFQGQLAETLLLFAALAASLLAAWIFFITVERPASRLARLMWPNPARTAVVA